MAKKNPSKRAAQEKVTAKKPATKPAENKSAPAVKRGAQPKKAKPQASSTKSTVDLKPEVTVQGDIISVVVKFHADKNGGHNHIIVDNIDDNHVSVGLTSDAKKGKNSTNYKLDMSPFPDGKKSYIRRQATIAPKKSYTSPRKGKMTSKNYDRAKEYGDRAKQKYIEKKNKKK